MRKILLLSFVMACSYMITDHYLSNMSTEEVPGVTYEKGFNIEAPCSTHGSHTNTVVGSRLVRFYEFLDTDGKTSLATEEQIISVLEMIEFRQGVDEVLNPTECVVYQIKQ